MEKVEKYSAQLLMMPSTTSSVTPLCLSMGGRR